MTSSRAGRAAGTPDVFAGLAEAGLTAVGVPTSLGGTGGGRDVALRAVMRVRQTDPGAAPVLASHQCVIGALLAGRNVGLCDDRVPALARGDTAGIWPSSAIDDMLHRGIAAAQVVEVGSVLMVTGPLGSVSVAARHPFVLLYPVQWSAAHAPGLALLDGAQHGLHLAALPTPDDGASGRQMASLDRAIFRAEDLVDKDGSRIAMMGELQTLHATIRSHLVRGTASDAVLTGALSRRNRE
jgi:hypothetical protein